MINEKLKELRKINSKTQKDVAEFIGVARVTYTNYENGNKRPPYEQLLKIAEFFNVSTDYLLGNETNIEEDQVSQSEKELSTLLSDPELMVAFEDYGSWSEDEKKALLNYIKGQKLLKEKGKE